MSEVPPRFKDKSLYEVLGIEKTANLKVIRSAYRSLALKLHPDKNPGNEAATAEFQFVTKAADVLTDEKRRKLYDRTGEIDEFNPSFETAEFWRQRFAAISKLDIVEFEKTYKKSAAELEDLERFYNEFKGDMNTVLTHVPLCSSDDVPRFKAHLDKQIKAKKLKGFKKYKQTINNLDMDEVFPDEEEEAKELAAELGLEQSHTENSDSALIALIKKRQSDRQDSHDDFLASLEAKYCQPKAKKSRTDKTKKAATASKTKATSKTTRARK